MPLFSEKKNRIYLAYFRRGVVREGDVKYHTAFLVLPKNPDREKKIGSRYHVKNVIMDNEEVWQFFRDKTLARTYTLIGLLQLGKIPLSIDDAALLKIFTEVKVVQGNPAWRCRHWAWEAIDLLVKNGVISLPPEMSAEKVWNAGYDFTENVDSEDLAKQDVPTCDILGHAITSEVGPL